MALRIKISPLDVLFSRYIRLRAHGWCARCHCYRGIAGLQCAHYHSRRKRSTRFDPDNAVALDVGCHQYFHENPDEFRAFMKLKLGERGLDMLDSRARITWPRPDEAAIELYLRKQIELLNNT